MGKSLSFDTGVVEYDINGAVKARFNPTDESFAAKVEKSFDALEGLQDRLEGTDGLEGFAELDAEMRATIDGLLGDGVSDALFHDMNCYAIADGLPVWMNLMLALMDEITEAYEREFGKTDARVKSHGEKYDALLAKYRRKTSRARK